MKIDRRQFLAAAAAATLSAHLPALAVDGRRAAVVVETQIPESVLFASAFPPRARLECSLDTPMALASALHDLLEDGRTVLGCTREATAFIMGELLRGSDYTREVIASHRRAGNHGMQHVVDGALVTPTAVFDDPAWPRLLGASLHTSGWRPARTRGEVAGRAPAAPGSPGYTVTWQIGHP